jgi:hypothetical protein
MKWGMTVAEVKALYGSDVKEWDGQAAGDRLLGERLTMPYTVGTVKMLAAFFTPDASRHITSVRLRPPSDHSDEMAFFKNMDDKTRSQYIRQHAQAVNALTEKLMTDQYYRDKRSYEELQEGLIAKYGAPTQTTDDAASGTKTMKWFFPSTMIDLTWIDVPLIHSGTLRLTYSAVDKKSVDSF